MKRIIRGLIIFIFLANATYAKTIETETLDKLMILSGLNKQLKSYPDMMKIGIEQELSKKDINQIELNQLIKNAQIAFNSNEITEDVKLYLKKYISNEDALLLLNWLKSKIGRNIIKSEEYSSTPAGYHQMITQAPDLFKNKERLKLVKEIDNLLKLSDFTINFAIKNAVTIASALVISDNPNKPLNKRKIHNVISNLIDKQKNNYIELTWLSLLFSYQNIEIKDINKYITFLQQPYTQNFQTKVLESLNITLDKSTDKLAKLWVISYQNIKYEQIK